jgi:hypothetical protein
MYHRYIGKESAYISRKNNRTLGVKVEDTNLISELPEQVLRRVAGRGGMDESSGWAGGLSLGRLDGKPAHDAPKVECM